MSDLSHAHSPIEHAVETLCGNLLKKSADFWEDRNKAMLELTRIINKFEDAPPATLFEVFNINVFRALIEPVKQMILDLRSQQVRDTAVFLTQLSRVTKDLMRFFLRETFESIIIAVKVPNKVMSGYVDECIQSMLEHTTFKCAIPVIIGEYRESKSKSAREKCLGYLNSILLSWDLVDKEADQIEDVIRLGLEDASMKGRELAREAFLTFKEIFPQKAERLKSTLNQPVLARVEKAELKYEHKKKKRAAEEKRRAEENQHHQHFVSTPASRGTISDDDVDNIIMTNTPGSQSNSREQDAVTSIQALIRGNMARRCSDRHTILQNNPGHSSSEYLDDNMEPIIVDASRGSTEFSNHGIDTQNHELNESRGSLMEPLYLQKPITPSDTNNAGATWFDSDQISPLTMDNGGRGSQENGRQVASPDKSPPRSSSSPTKLSPAGSSTRTKYLASSQDSRELHDTDIQVGMRVMVKDRQPVLQGIVQYAGQTQFASGYWVGIRLDDPLGKNNGIVRGVKYFQCPPLHGLFVRPQQLSIIPRSNEIESMNIPSELNITKSENSPRRSLNNKVLESPSRTNAEKLRETLNIAHALKVKISKEMHMLNHQLEVVENFESQVQGTEGVNQEDCRQFIAALMHVVHEEEALCSEFRNLLEGHPQPN